MAFNPRDMMGRRAIERRLGIEDSRGPQGMFSRGSNVYRGGLPNAQMGGGNPNIGRPSSNSGGNPSTDSINTGLPNPSPTLTTLVGSLPPNSGNPDAGMNDAVMALLRNKFNRSTPVA